MSAGYVSPPGSEYGPCLEVCAHRDCAASRTTADDLCLECKEPIGYGVAYYREFDKANVFLGHEHETCTYLRLGV